MLNQLLNFSSPPIPPNPKINYNQRIQYLSLLKYFNDFHRNSTNFEAPFLAAAAELNNDSNTLDFGCGLGRLAYAFAKNGRSGNYFGWEPDLSAREYLQTQYSFNPRFKFSGSLISDSQNYVSGITGTGTPHTTAVPDSDIWRKFIGNTKFDLICSFSVFTHTWPSDTEQIIKLMRKGLKREGLMVHTFLIVDEFAKQQLELGLCDRRLPLEIGGILTYSERNPLVCTAYRKQDIDIIFSNASMSIEKILYGSWSGRDNGVTYQDIVIARPST